MEEMMDKKLGKVNQATVHCTVGAQGEEASSAKVEELLEYAIAWAKEAGIYMVERMKTSMKIDRKVNASDLVTESDRQCEELLRSKIKSHFPEHWILSEETDGERADPYTIAALQGEKAGYGWIIDPIDGTTNYIHGLPYFAISIGIIDQGQPVAGVVYNPKTEETFTAMQGQGAYYNGQPIHVSMEQELSHSLLATGFYAGDWIVDSPIVPQIASFIGQCRSLRIYGSSSIDLCLVASGILSGFWHRGLRSWDVAAGLLIVQEAGGIVTNYAGNPYSLSDDTLVASNALIHESLRSLL